MDSDNAEGIGRLRLVSELLYRRQGIPELALQVDGPDTNDAEFTVGDWIRLKDHPTLKDEILVGTDGELTKSFDQTSLIGYIVERRPLWQNADAFELRVAFANFPVNRLVRWRAPSLIVTAVDGTGTVITTDPTSNFGFTSSDNNAFSVGDGAEAWAPDGVQRVSGIRLISAIGPNTITLSSAFTSPPSIGDIIRLPKAPNYNNPNVIPGTTRPYAYHAIAGNLSAFGEADIYG